MERETKEFTTPGGNKLVLKTYLTGREVNNVLKQIFGSQEVSSQGGVPQTKLSMVVGIERNIKLIETAVASLDGSSENLADRLQDLPSKDYAAILNEVKNLADGNF